jgi:hypothetical protein
MRSKASPSLRLWTAIGALVVIAAGMTLWRINSNDDETLYGSFSAPTFGSVEELTAAANLVVEGVVRGVAGRELDYGTANLEERAGEPGVPFVYYDIEIIDTLKGATTASIVVGNVDGENLISDQITPLEPGDRVLLFLIEQIREQDSPGLTMFDFYYTTLSLDAGIFDVLSDGTIRPRAPALVGTSDVALTREEVAGLVSES